MPAKVDRRRRRSPILLSPIEHGMVKLKRAMAVYLPPILNVGGTILLGYAWIRYRAWFGALEPAQVPDGGDGVGLFAGSAAAWPLWSGAASMLIGTIWSAARTRRNDRLVSDNERLSARLDDLEESNAGLVDRHLEALKKLVYQELWRLYNEKLDRSNDCRVSVYRHVGQGFQLISRCSIQPDYKRAGRTAYPEAEGVIGRAWQQGEHEVHGLPDFDHDSGAYYDRLEQMSIRREVAENFAMKSRSLLGIAIEDGQSRERIGVLVVESVQEAEIPADVVRQCIPGVSSALNDYLAALVDSGDPSLAHARSQGF